MGVLSVGGIVITSYSIHYTKLYEALGFLQVVWLTWTYLTYDQVDDEEAVQRKADELQRMAEGSRFLRTNTNVIVILFDDLGYGDLGAFGSEALKTPRIDQIASEGVALDQFYAAAPVCTP